MSISMTSLIRRSLHPALLIAALTLSCGDLNVENPNATAPVAEASSE